MLPWMLVLAATAAPFDLHEHMTAVCAVEVSMIPVDAALAEVDLEPRRGSVGMLVRVSPTGVQVDGDPVVADALTRKFAEKRAAAEDLAARIGGEAYRFRGQVLVAVTRDATAANVAPVLDGLAAGGFTQAWFVVNSAQPLALPELPDAKLAKKLIGSDGGIREQAFSDAWTAELAACPPLNAALDQVRKVPPGNKCMTMADVLPAAAAQCKKDVARRTGTFLQLNRLPRNDRTTTGWEITLDPTADPLHTAPETLWPDLIPLLLEREGQAIRLISGV